MLQTSFFVQCRSCVFGLEIGISFVAPSDEHLETETGEPSGRFGIICGQSLTDLSLALSENLH